VQLIVASAARRGRSHVAPPLTPSPLAFGSLIGILARYSAPEVLAIWLFPALTFLKV